MHAGIPPLQGDLLQGDPTPRKTPSRENPPPERHPPSRETPLRETPSPRRPPSRPTPRGKIEGDQIQAHTKWGNWGGSDPGPHPRGKLRGIRPRLPPQMPTTAAGGTHPTGMHSCIYFCLLFTKLFGLQNHNLLPSDNWQLTKQYIYSRISSYTMSFLSRMKKLPKFLSHPLTFYVFPENHARIFWKLSGRSQVLRTLMRQFV